MDNLSKEKGTVFLSGDFDIDLLNYDQHSPTNEFLDNFSSHMLLSHIVQPARNRNNSKTLIDNTYSHMITPINILGNLTATLFHHLAQFVIASNIFNNPSSTKLNIFERDCSKFD